MCSVRYLFPLLVSGPTDESLLRALSLQNILSCLFRTKKEVLVRFGSGDAVQRWQEHLDTLKIRVDKLNGVEVSFTGSFHTLIVRHRDIAGELADMTRELSNSRTNIANMRLCRDRRGGDALTVIETDQPVPPVVRQLIAELPGVDGLTYYEKEDE